MVVAAGNRVVQEGCNLFDAGSVAVIEDWTAELEGKNSGIRVLLQAQNSFETAGARIGAGERDAGRERKESRRTGRKGEKTATRSIRFNGDCTVEHGEEMQSRETKSQGSREARLSLPNCM